MTEQESFPMVIKAKHLYHRYDNSIALNDLSLTVPAGKLCGIIGPDGVGKSTLLSLIAGARVQQQGQLDVLDCNLQIPAQRKYLQRHLAYLPQGLGKNLYPTLSVIENLNFFAELFAIPNLQRQQRIKYLLSATGLWPFRHRPSEKLSGGMKQKLGLCCALIHNPKLLLLDEPTTGVDPLSRRQFWQLINRIRQQQPDISILVATGYMDEAMSFDWLAAMNDGELLACGSPSNLLTKTHTENLEQAFVKLLSVKSDVEDNATVETTSCSKLDEYNPKHQQPIAIEANNLTLKFGDFTAVADASFSIRQGEIFGFLGSNGCGKTTTMKMLTGLLTPTSGSAQLLGKPLGKHATDNRRRIGYMTQNFSLYEELTVAQNLQLHAKLFDLSSLEMEQRITSLAEQLDLVDLMPLLAKQLPLGERQRLSLAVALVHQPDVLILDEPTSGVDPVARDTFWQIIQKLAQEQGVTVFISTHFMNEAQRCDRISLMHAGQVLITDTPNNIVQSSGKNTLEDAFIHYLEQAADAPHNSQEPDTDTQQLSIEPSKPSPKLKGAGFSWRRLLSISRRETLELLRDPIRLVMALTGSVILMFVLGYGINMDVEEIDFAVIDRDKTSTSRDYILNLAGSRYFEQQSEISNYVELDELMRRGDISLAIEIPNQFTRKLQRGESVAIGAWIDGSMPMRAETVQGYIQGMHRDWLIQQSRTLSSAPAITSAVTIENRYRYNPDVESLAAMVPAVIPLLLMLFPAILTSLSVVREKELGSITNFYVTPTRKSEFFIGKQIPYVLLGVINFFILFAEATLLFDVPLTGSLLALTIATILYVVVATALGLIMSAFLNSQIAALFGTALATLLPATQFSGMITPVTSLEGLGRWIGEIYPTSFYVISSRGVFSKALDINQLLPMILGLLIAAIVCTLTGIALIKKQEQ